MLFGDILTFRKDLYFDGAVQIDWFYQKEKSSKVAENFVFHSSEYFGSNDEGTGRSLTDTVSFVQKLAERLYDEQQVNPFTLAIAGYGTGKSHLGVTMAQLLSGSKYMPETYQKIIRNLEYIDKSKSIEITKLTKQPNLVLVINGMKDFNLHYEVLNAAKRSLELYGCNTDSLKKLNRALETAFVFFEKNASISLPLFERIAEKNEWYEKGSLLVEKLRTNLGNDDIAFNIINEAYAENTGHEIRWDEGVSAGRVLETLLQEYCGASGQFEKIVLIFDEFGRYLEYASSALTAQSGDSGLQQIFEVAQNAEGSIQVINFIQSDIKTYLQRVDQTSNISRYIGRYDVSNKDYLSSNLETVFANLIQRQDKTAFNEIIKNWQEKSEQKWEKLFNAMEGWLPLQGLWSDYRLFRQLIVEGIYPLHPLTTYMLSTLSDYLQNRSSLTLVSNYIQKLADYDLLKNVALPMILPEQLLEGDLFTEMLSSEQEGRQLSQHCIRLHNILRKANDKLTENSLKVLRSNLILRILRFRTQDYEDVKYALSICSGLTVTQIEAELIWLEDEYAFLGYDEHACCFDFLEDSSGAQDFRTFFRRLKAQTKISLSILENSRIRELAGVISNQSTDFATQKRIKSNEWQFEQKLLALQDLSEAYIDLCLKEWREATTTDRIKGKLIWLYANKETEIDFLENAQKLSVKLNSTPIVLMLLNDTEDRLINVMKDYDTLTKVSEIEQKKYGRHYDDVLEQTENNVRSEFEVLKKKRQQVIENGTIEMEKRLALGLSDVFQTVYPDAIPFYFDGFDNKQPSNARKAFCSIVKLILTGNLSDNIVHSFTSEIRNRFEATLYYLGRYSWNCVSADYHFTEPKEKSASNAYKQLENMIRTEGQINGKKILEYFSNPPFGMNDYIIVYLVSVLCANIHYCLRMELDGNMLNTQNWSNYILDDKKIKLNEFQNTCFQVIEVGEINARFYNLIEQIKANQDINKVPELNSKLDKLILAEEIPEEIEEPLKFAKYRLDRDLKVYKNWVEENGRLLDKYNGALDEQNLSAFSALSTLSILNSTKLYAILYDNDFVITDEIEEKFEKMRMELDCYILAHIDEWIKMQRCEAVSKMSDYDKHMDKLAKMLKMLGYEEKAQLMLAQKEIELSNKEVIQERQNLKTNCEIFLNEVIINQYSSYVQLCDWFHRGVKLLKLLDKNEYILGKNTKQVHTAVEERTKKVARGVKQIKTEMESIWDDVYELKDVKSIDSMIIRINKLTQQGISDKDLKDYIELKEFLKEFLEDVNIFEKLNFKRKTITNVYLELKEKYSNQEISIDLLNVLEAIYNNYRISMDEKEVEWVKKYLHLENDRTKILLWLDSTFILPGYLKESTVDDYFVLKREAEDMISKCKIDDVVYHFEKLNDIEKVECLNKLRGHVLQENSFVLINDINELKRE